MNKKLIERCLAPQITRDLERKMVFLGGPRQSGKTTLAKMLLGREVETRYFNWDDIVDRELLIKERLPVREGLIVLDEVHKNRFWRRMVKGWFDKYGDRVRILVTGSARLDHYRYGGDSLQGRYHFLRLHPLSVAELRLSTPGEVKKLLAFGGFPEPYFLKDATETKRWSREYRTRVIKDDVRDLEHVMDIGLLERLALRLPDLVGSPLSINSLREDLGVSHIAVSHWLEILERLYFIFRIPPFGPPKIKAVKKETKHYLFDWTQVSDPGKRFENMVACHLLKWCHYLEDTQGRAMELRYFRDVELHEVDFVLMEDGKPTLFVECKTSNLEISKGFYYLHHRMPGIPALQVVLDEERDFVEKSGIRVCGAARFLRELV
jgi:predicted AAA+ superfamily ATPase